MASPTVTSITVTAFTSTATAHAVNMPATVVAGELLLMHVGANPEPTYTTPTGWSIVAVKANITNVSTIIFGKVADGTEGGTTVGVTTSLGARLEAQVFRITAWNGSLTDVVAGTPVAATGTANWDPPSASWTWGTADVLALAFSAEQPDTNTVSTYPASYTNGQRDANGTGGVNGVVLATARRALTAAASPENPATGTWSAVQGNVSNTVVVSGIRSAALTRNPTSSITNTATLGRVSGEQRNPTSSIANTAAVSRLSGMLRTVASSIAHTAVLARLKGAVRSPASNIVHTAAVARAVAVARTVASSIAHTAAVTYAIVGHAPIRTLTTSIAHTAVVSRSTTAVRTVASSIAHTAALSRLMASIRGAASSIAHSAALARVKAAPRTLTSSIAHMAVLGRFGPNVRTLASSIAHTAALTYQWISGNPKVPTYIDLEARDAPFIDLDAYDRTTIDLEARDAAFIDLEARDA